MADFQINSPRPYLIRAWHEWMQDNGLTPHLVVRVDEHVVVPREHVKDGEIILNVSIGATGSLNLGNKTISFQARFAGKVQNISFPVDCVASVFARETGQGMEFDLTDEVFSEAPESGYDYGSSYSGLSVVEDSNNEDAEDTNIELDNKNQAKDGKNSNLRIID